jgi:hypothetical protein
MIKIIGCIALITVTIATVIITIDGLRTSKELRDYIEEDKK